jgi:hypothetical protein
MTKHPEPNRNDSPHSGRICAVLQALEGGVDLCDQRLKNPKHGLSLVGLPIAEAYLKRSLLIYVVYERHFGVDALNSTGKDNRKVRKGTTISKADMFDPNFLTGGQQNHVFVGDVQNMQVDKILPVPSLVRLYDVENVVDDVLVGGVPGFGMSIDGTLKALPIRMIDNGEFNMLVDSSSIGFDKNTVSVVQSGPEVMQRVAQNGGSMPRERLANGCDAFPELTISIGPHSLSVASKVHLKNVFKLQDVLFGPFGL